jgi:hypothetical protein
MLYVWAYLQLPVIKHFLYPGKLVMEAASRRNLGHSAGDTWGEFQER